MGMMKQYFLRLLEQGDTNEEQLAIEAAIRNDWVHLTYRLKQDQEEVLLRKREFMHRLDELGDRKASAKAIKRRAGKKSVRVRGRLLKTGVQDTSEARSKKLNREKSRDGSQRRRVKQGE